MDANFSQKDIVDKTRKNFDAIEINIYGSREVTWLDGSTRSEKDFAALLKVQFTPTLLFLDEKGNIALRVNGYYPPHRFMAALDYVAQRNEHKVSFGNSSKATRAATTAACFTTRHSSAGNRMCSTPQARYAPARGILRTAELLRLR